MPYPFFISLRCPACRFVSTYIDDYRPHVTCDNCCYDFLKIEGKRKRRTVEMIERANQRVKRYISGET